ncbi:MAG TPA: hypothetical protein VIH37_02135 [Candidatus Limnocylindrales bacterium]
MSASRVVLAVAGSALLLAACGSSPGGSSGVATLPSQSAASSAGASPIATPSASGRVAQAVAYAQCVRAHGVASWPDPDSSGRFTKMTAQQLGVSETLLQSAEATCQPILSTGDDAARQNKLHQGLTQLLAFAQCMRAHGIVDMPDPNSQGQFAVGPGTSISIDTDQFHAAQDACSATPSPSSSTSP